MNAASMAFSLTLAAYAAGAVFSLLARSSRVARGITAVAAAVGSGAGCVTALGVLLTDLPIAGSVPWLLAPAGGLVVTLDPLGAFFLLIISVIALPAALYGFAYTSEYDGRYSLGIFGAMFNLFLMGMSLVASAGNILTFVLAWELMAVASYFLVMTEVHDERTRTAGLWYIAMAHVGLVLLLPMFFLLIPGSGDTTFEALRAGAGSLTTGTRSVVFLLALLAFGSKAGLAPLHVWLPRAHPAAPSHVSALMSGVMIKLGIYGLLRIALDLLGGGPAWWGGLLLAIGSVSALLGVLYALTDNDLKRLLAYSSVENIGIIAIGVGAGLLLHSYDLDGLAMVALAGALFHSLNHACFKGLLFLAAGNVLHRAHTRNLEEMGGLIKVMPQTAALFFIGSVAISALPPLNGFASEWMIFQGLLGGTYIPRPEVAVAIPVAVGMLALTSGLAAACFVKAFGIGFLAMPRSDRAAHAVEAPMAMRASMWALAAACVLLGLGASAVVPSIYHVVDGLGGLAPAFPVESGPTWWIHAPRRLGEISPGLLGGLLIALAGVGLLLLRARHARRRTEDTWGCGRLVQTPRMEYTSAAFAEPLRRVFSELYRPSRDLAISRHPDSPHFVQSISYRSEVRPWVEGVFYTPILRSVRTTGAYIRRLQGGSVHLYLLYVVVALIVALASVWWF